MRSPIPLRRLFDRPTSAAGTLIVALFLVMAFLGPWIAPYGENEQIYTDLSQPPSSEHWMGTDHLGRDVFSRVVLGAQDVLLLAGVGTLLAVLAGTLLGLVSGYRGGLFDEGLMRLSDSLLALPALLLSLVFLGTLGTSTFGVMIVIAIVYFPIVARVVRSVTLDIKSRGFVETARLQGESHRHILFREIFPSVLPSLTVETALRFSYAIFLIASLGFLGVGVQPPSANWGLMVKEGRIFVSEAPWELVFPALAISILVIGVNLMADGFRRSVQNRT
ncbi:MAG TPA: ABC transporter permease [Anaerolineales bacterium]|nr:ABC transporter permease [Anaerolineales bacterium]